MNELQKFEEQYLESFKQLQKLSKAKKKVEAEEKAVKQQLEKALLEYNIKSIDNEFVRITYVEGTTSKSIDSKKIQTQSPDFYDKLIKQYEKVTVKKPYVRITVK